MLFSDKELSLIIFHVTQILEDKERCILVFF